MFCGAPNYQSHTLVSLVFRRPHHSTASCPFLSNADLKLLILCVLIWELRRLPNQTVPILRGEMLVDKSWAWSSITTMSNHLILRIHSSSRKELSLLIQAQAVHDMSSLQGGMFCPVAIPAGLDSKPQCNVDVEKAMRLLQEVKASEHADSDLSRCVADVQNVLSSPLFSVLLGTKICLVKLCLCE